MKKVDHNIKSIISLVGNTDRLIPHAKTHKSKDTLKKVDKELPNIKHLLKWLEILAECEPDLLILAYPITSKIKSERLSKIVKKFPKTKFSTIISTKYHYDLIKDINNLDGFYIDLDTGMNRTGVLRENVDELLDYIRMSKNKNLKGIHAYDGQTYGIVSVEERTLDTKKLCLISEM